MDVRVPRAVLGSVPSGLLLSTAVGMALVAFAGYAALDVSWIAENKTFEKSPLYSGGFDQILLRNLGAALVLYSGVVTLGLTTLVAGGILALYVGATVALGVNSVGVAQLLADVAWYVPFEFSGLVLAAAAGLQPAFGAARLVLLHKGKISLTSLQRDLSASLRTLSVGSAFITVAAVIESVLISLRTA
jgi:uncharacterized membrane protein SpoIIM required for sporulation